jgi:hypothetical protein
MVSHIVASHIVAHAEPARALISYEVIDRVFGGFGFHEPGGHRRGIKSYKCNENDIFVAFREKM